MIEGALNLVLCVAGIWLIVWVVFHVITEEFK